MGNTFTALGYLAVAAAFLGNLAVPILSLATRNDPATVGTTILGVLAAILTIIISICQRYRFNKQPQPAQVTSDIIDSPAAAIAVAHLLFAASGAQPETRASECKVSKERGLFEKAGTKPPVELKNVLAATDPIILAKAIVSLPAPSVPSAEILLSALHSATQMEGQGQPRRSLQVLSGAIRAARDPSKAATIVADLTVSFPAYDPILTAALTATTEATLANALVAVPSPSERSAEKLIAALLAATQGHPQASAQVLRGAIQKAPHQEIVTRVLTQLSSQWQANAHTLIVAGIVKDAITQA
jgi:hypothetical protein